jgi:hypothetical protein
MDDKIKDGRKIFHVGGRGEICTGFWYEKLQERDRMEDLNVVGKIMKMDLEETGHERGAGSFWFRIWTSCAFCRYSNVPSS